MTVKETFDKAYGHIPKEVNSDGLWDWIPTSRTLAYYYLKVVRFFTR